jgi:hypothetical protein
MIGSGDFTALYDRCRIGTAIDCHTGKARVCRRWRTSLLVATGILLILAAVCDALANNFPSSAGAWAVAGGILTFAALALAAAVVTSGYGRQAKLHQDAAEALIAIRDLRPGPTARESEVTQWIWQTETILHGAQADPSPLRGILADSPASRRAQ